MYPSNINPSPIKKTFYILLYRHEFFTGKFTTPKIHTKLHFYFFIYLFINYFFIDVKGQKIINKLKIAQ